MDNLQLAQSGSFSLNSTALALATTVTLVKTTAVANYTIDGQFFTKAATDNIPFAVQFTSLTFNKEPLAQPDLTTALYGVFLDSAGTFTFVHGRTVPTLDLANGAAALQFSQNTDVQTLGAGLPRGRACIGFVRVVNASGLPFVFGSTALNLAGVTTTYINTMTVPGEPLRS